MRLRLMISSDMLVSWLITTHCSSQGKCQRRTGLIAVGALRSRLNMFKVGELERRSMLSDNSIL